YGIHDLNTCAVGNNQPSSLTTHLGDLCEPKMFHQNTGPKEALALGLARTLKYYRNQVSLSSKRLQFYRYPTYAQTCFTNSSQHFATTGDNPSLIVTANRNCRDETALLKPTETVLLLQTSGSALI